MNRNLKPILVAVLLLIIIAVAAVLYGDLSSKYDDNTLLMNENTSVKAIDFTVRDSQGKDVSLFEKNISGVVVNFWASWCQPCKSEMEHFEKMFEKYGDKVQFMMVNMTDGKQETKEDADTFINEMGYTFPVFYDSYYSAYNAYSVTSIPATYFINKEGDIVTYANGMINEKQLESGIELILLEDK